MKMKKISKVKAFHSKGHTLPQGDLSAVLFLMYLFTYVFLVSMLKPEVSLLQGLRKGKRERMKRC